MKSQEGFVFLTADEMAEADKEAIEGFGIETTALMENAGVATAVLARRVLGGDASGKELQFFAGRGNNGGDGLVAARHLHNWGAHVRVILGGEKEDLRDLPARQLASVEKMGIGVSGPDGEFGRADLLIDALLGYGSKGDPREPVAGLIRRVNASGTPVLSVDLPSGLDATTGEPGEPCVAARATVTFGSLKTGFLNPKAKALSGELYLADISLPRHAMGDSEKEDIFGKDALVRVW